MFKKLLASVGIGAAKVDTILETEEVVPGQPFRAEIQIQGGDVEQEISGLELAIVTRVEVETDDGEHMENHTIGKWQIDDSFTLQPGEQRTIPFEAVLPHETPVTALNCPVNRCQVWLATGLEIDLALDASDRDMLEVFPTEPMRKFAEALENNGYYLQSADVEKGDLRGDGFESTVGCYQELEYRPESGGLFGIKEIEVSFVPEDEQTHVLLEVDRSFLGDGFIALTLPHIGVDVADIQALLEQRLG